MDHSSSSCDEEAQPYEKLPSSDGKDLICADNSLDDVVYELRMEPATLEQEAAATDAVELDAVSGYHNNSLHFWET